MTLTTQYQNEGLLCEDIPSEPCPEIGKILVTGATGYIGGRLVPELLARGYSVRVMVRTSSGWDENTWPGAEVVVADALDPESLREAMKDITVAYYLIHSLQLGPKEFQETDIRAAVNFREAAEERGLKRIIYLGGLGDERMDLSDHLLSRTQVTEELAKGKVPLTTLRAAVIIGSGSASYEIIQNLVKNLPFVLIPHWARNRCQPIGVRDVIKYLVGVLEKSETTGRKFDIGGPDILTYEEMMKIVSRILKRKTPFIRVPFSNIRLYSYLASLFTPVPAPLTISLIEGLKNEVICMDDEIKKILPFEPLSYKETVVRAISREEQDRIHTRWSDAYPPSHELAMKLYELKDQPMYTTSYSISSRKSAGALFASVCNIGGKKGWFHNNWMWRLRGAVDRILMGVGTSRGRKSYTELKVDDVIDFWRIEDIQLEKRLLLRAEMKLPGKAWLEFSIGRATGENTLRVTAYYYTDSLCGRIYWYIFLPFHRIIFQDLIKQIESRAQ